MGQRLSRSTKSGVENDFKDLTEQQLEEVKTVWKRCRESPNVGQEMMLKLIEKRPEVGKFFGLDGQRSDSHTSIRLQGTRIEKFFDVIFLALTQKSEIVVSEQCRTVGSIHYCRGVNLGNDDLLEFGKIIIEVVMSKYQKSPGSNKDDAELREHWRNLLMKLIIEFNVGYKKESQASSSEAPKFGYAKRKRVKKTPTIKRRNLSVPSFVNFGGERGHFVLSPLEVEAVRMSWQSVSLYKDIGIELILRMIVEKPYYGTSIGIDMTKEVSELWMDQNVRVQGHRIHLFFDTMVNLYDPDSLDNLKHMCKRVGAVHFYTNVHFTADIWVLLKRGIIEIVTNTTLSELNSPGSQRKNNFEVGAWDKLMRWIIKEMKKGFLEEAHKSGTNK